MTGQQLAEQIARECEVTLGPWEIVIPGMVSACDESGKTYIDVWYKYTDRDGLHKPRIDLGGVLLTGNILTLWLRKQLNLKMLTVYTDLDSLPKFNGDWDK